MTDKPTQHVLVFPLPAQGHVRPSLKLAELLSTANLYVTFVNTEYFHRRIIHSLTKINRPNLRFLTIPDGLPEDDPRCLIRFMDVQESMRTRSREHYRKMLLQTDWPKISCVIADGANPLAYEVAEEEEIPVMLISTSSACCLLAYFAIPELIDLGDIPLAEGADMDELVKGVPGMETFLRRRDLPTFIRDAQSVDDPTLQIRIRDNFARAKSLILNTTEYIDADVLSDLRVMCPNIYPVGPIHVLLENIDQRNNEGKALSSNSVNQWIEDVSCITWLDSQPDKSVVYVSFGSITIMSKETLLEFYHGFVSSGRKFLWVIRSDMVEGGVSLSDLVPLKHVEERGCVVSWAPQEEVLAHPSIGCFLTHSGWNSTMESIVAGVPMICWPFFADQQINSRFVSDVWKIGVDMKDTSGRDIVEKMVREVLDGEKSEEFKKNAGDIADAVKKSCKIGGESYMNFQRLVDHIKSLNAN